MTTEKQIGGKEYAIHNFGFNSLVVVQHNWNVTGTIGFYSVLNACDLTNDFIVAVFRVKPKAA